MSIAVAHRIIAADPDKLVQEALGLGVLCAVILSVFALPTIA